MQSQLLENIFIYKKTTALLAAFQLGLFRKIKEKGYLNMDICRQLGWNERYTELLCIYLVNEGYLTKVDDGWQNIKDIENQLDTFEKICRHESSIYHKWLSPELITQSVQSVKDGRLFDKEKFTTEEQRAYDNTMYGDNIKLIALHLLRKIRGMKTSLLRCLEYGRSDGLIGQALKKHNPEIIIEAFSLDQTFDEQILYDVILMYNTIHYKTPNEWQAIFMQMKMLLNEKGVICIADVFYRKDTVFQSTVLLDWITHGGVYNICICDVYNQLQSIGFAKIEQQSLDSISTDLLIAYK